MTFVTKKKVWLRYTMMVIIPLKVNCNADWSNDETIHEIINQSKMRFKKMNSVKEIFKHFYEGKFDFIAMYLEFFKISITLN